MTRQQPFTAIVELNDRYRACFSLLQLAAPLVVGGIPALPKHGELYELSKTLASYADVTNYLLPQQKVEYERVITAGGRIRESRQQALSVLEWLVLPDGLDPFTYKWTETETDVIPVDQSGEFWPKTGTETVDREVPHWKQLSGKEQLSMTDWQIFFGLQQLDACSGIEWYQAGRSLKDILYDRSDLYTEEEREIALSHLRRMFPQGSGLSLNTSVSFAQHSLYADVKHGTVIPIPIGRGRPLGRLHAVVSDISDKEVLLETMMEHLETNIIVRAVLGQQDAHGDGDQEVISVLETLLGWSKNKISFKTLPYDSRGGKELVVQVRFPYLDIDLIEISPRGIPNSTLEKTTMLGVDKGKYQELVRP